MPRVTLLVQNAVLTILLEHKRTSPHRALQSLCKPQENMSCLLFKSAILNVRPLYPKGRT
jgi:hypothetical protein